MEKRERATTTSRQYSIKAVCVVKSHHFASVRPEQKKLSANLMHVVLQLSGTGEEEEGWMDVPLSSSSF